MFTARIKFMDVENEEKMTTSNGYYNLHIHSYKSLLLLNYLLQYKYNTGNRKWRSYGSGRDSIKGGGFLIKAEPIMTVNTAGDVGIYFDNRWRLSRAFKGCNDSSQEMMTAIMTKMANELKQMWLAKFDGSEDGTLYIAYKDYAQLTTSTYSQNFYLQLPSDVQLVKYPYEANEAVSEEDKEKDYIEITEYEYRSLYEFLKNRIKSNTIRKYGEEAYNTMIGKQIEDQFIISAIDVLKAEIQKTIKESEDQYHMVAEERNQKIEDLKSEYKMKLDEIEAAKESKILDLKNQILEMQKMAV